MDSTHVVRADLNRSDDLRRFYSAVEVLGEKIGGARKLAECSGRLDWPTRGVYFFMEAGEVREDGRSPWIVRVGTHALKDAATTKLWSRLSQHRGPNITGRGNHRGSIFRLIVGTAIMAGGSLEFPTWGAGDSAPAEVRADDVVLECEVGKVIGAMPFLWLAVDDKAGADSLRGYIERNAIALLSNFGKVPLDAPSAGWLGHSCNRERVRLSGLWNSRHVNEPYDSEFLPCLTQLIADGVDLLLQGL